jgi:hypothetical protein
MKNKVFFRLFTAPANKDTDPIPLLRFLKNFGRNIKATALFFLAGIVRAVSVLRAAWRFCPSIWP